MTLTDFITQLSETPNQIEFDQTIAVIDNHYQFTPTQFKNGELVNTFDQNQGSCKILAFGQRHNLTVAQTLACFGRYFREEVKNNPDADNHQNIRQFMVTGWQGVDFASDPLNAKSSES